MADVTVTAPESTQRVQTSAETDQKAFPKFGASLIQRTGLS